MNEHKFTIKLNEGQIRLLQQQLREYEEDGSTLPVGAMPLYEAVRDYDPTEPVQEGEEVAMIGENGMSIWAIVVAIMPEFAFVAYGESLYLCHKKDYPDGFRVVRDGIALAPWPEEQ